MRMVLAILAASAFAMPAWAQTGTTHFGMAQLTIETAPAQMDVAKQCTFTVECFDGDGCEETAFNTSLEGRAGGMSASDMVADVKLVTDAETTVLIGVISNGTYSLSGGNFSARHLMTIAASGDTRYTLHLADGPMALTYLGTCKDT